MKALGFLLAISLSLPVLAQPSALGPEGQPPPLGKLFLSPEKRQSLDRQRQLNLSDDDGMDNETVRLDGVVHRSSGYNSVWINQRMQPRTQSKGRPGAEATSSSVELEQGRQIRLHVGESINRTTRERKDVVAPGAVNVGRPHH